jgi:hypothetical protein
MDWPGAKRFAGWPFLLSWQMPQTDKGKPKGMCRDGEEHHRDRAALFAN